jgi:hypothetical protein
MHRRPRITRKNGLMAAVAAAVMALSAIVGVVGARPASAAPSPNLCIRDANVSWCLWAPSVAGGNVEVRPEPGSVWTYPAINNGNNGYGTIMANGLCLQLNHAGGDVARMATCNGDLAEVWQNVYDAADSRTWFESAWANTYEPLPNRCLSGLPVTTLPNVFVQACASIYWFDWGSS